MALDKKQETKNLLIVNKTCSNFIFLFIVSFLQGFYVIPILVFAFFLVKIKWLISTCCYCSNLFDRLLQLRKKYVYFNPVSFPVADIRKNAKRAKVCNIDHIQYSHANNVKQIAIFGEKQSRLISIHDRWFQSLNPMPHRASVK